MKTETYYLKSFSELEKTFERKHKQKQLSRCACKKRILKHFTKFTGKHLCHRIFFNKVAGFSPATLLKKRPWHRCFPVNFAKFLKTHFCIEHLWWLLLHKLTYNAQTAEFSFALSLRLVWIVFLFVEHITPIF